MREGVQCASSARLRLRVTAAPGVYLGTSSSTRLFSGVGVGER